MEHLSFQEIVDEIQSDLNSLLSYDAKGRFFRVKQTSSKHYELGTQISFREPFLKVEHVRDSRDWNGVSSEYVKLYLRLFEDDLLISVFTGDEGDETDLQKTRFREWFKSDFDVYFSAFWTAWDNLYSSKDST